MNFVTIKSSEIPKVREVLLKEQAGICPICEQIVNSPCLDHKHSTKTKGITEIDGMVRKVICRACNSLIGVIENNHKRFGISEEALPTMLKNISIYLAGQPYTNLLHPIEEKKHKPKTNKTQNKPRSTKSS